MTNNNNNNNKLPTYHELEAYVSSLLEDNKRVESVLQSSNTQNMVLHAKVKAATDKNKIMIGGDPFPSYPDEETCINDQMNNGKTGIEAENLCSKLSAKSARCTKQASHNNNSTKKELPAWVVNNPFMSAYSGIAVTTTTETERTKQASINTNNKKELPAWVQNNPLLTSKAGIVGDASNHFVILQ